MTRWWMHPGLWMAAGALAYPLGKAAVWALIRSDPDGYVFGA